MDQKSYKKVSIMGIRILVVTILLGYASSDVEKDREKCASQLVAVATCLPYVSGEAMSPPPDCCTGFKQVLKDSRECICLLIKDRNDPTLGLQINATRAFALPARCNTPLNQSITDCPAILHLPPNSPDAKIFEDFGKNGNITNSTASPAAASSRMPANGDEKSDGGQKWRLMVSGLIPIAALYIIFISL